MTLLPPLSLYVHLPWCIKKCPYCDYNAHALDGHLPEEEYFAQLQQDLAQELDAVAGRPIHSIFFGGGTPSIMSVEFYHRLMSFLQQHLTFKPNLEITMEANPGASEQSKFEGFYAAGINRLSIGVQSFHDPHLEILGRQHNSHMAKQAIQAAKRAGFSNFNIDLMHALPQQTEAQALADLQQAVELGATHISWYELTIEPNTVFFSFPPRQPDLDQWADTEEAGFAYLAEQGFPRYEISAFASKAYENQHNLNYWRFADYIGIGAGAHGKITSVDGTITRYQKTRHPKHYLLPDGHTRRNTMRLNQDDLPLEFMLNALRLIDGVPSDTFTQHTGLPLSTIAEPWQQLQQQGLMVPNTQHLACTPLGLRFLNQVLEAFH